MNRIDKNKQRFLDKVNKKYCNKYSYDLTNYKTIESIITIICPIHGEFKQSADSHFNSKYGCPECGNDKRKGGKRQLSYYINKFKNIKYINDNKYIYIDDVNKYVSIDDKINAICPIHGNIKLIIATHLNGAGCIKCAENYTANLRKQKSIELFKKYDDSEAIFDTYNGWDNKMDFNCPIHGIYQQTPNNHFTQNQSCPKCGNTRRKTQLEIFEFVQSLNDDVIYEYKINKTEFDIRCDNILIEYDGLLWHSFGKTFPNNISDINSNIHVNKTIIAEQNNYNLLRIWENEWLDFNKQKIWKSIISNKLNQSNKIYARKCQVKEIKNNDIIKFLNDNHIQGYVSSNINIGLFYNDELVSLMTFNKPRFNKNIDYELIRFCNKLNTTIIGGASKLLKYFERKYNPTTIISYANRRWSQGNLYEKLGFKFIKNTEPNFFYIDKNMKLYSRMSFQKHKLKDKIKNFKPELSARENMINNDYRIIYDCGNKVYIKTLGENNE